MFDHSLLGEHFDAPVDRFDRSEEFLQELICFDEFDRSTRYSIEDGIPYFVNQFWTSAQRCSHSLHEIPHFGCFKPNLPQFFIEKLTSSGGVVLDPFAGRGTTAVQAAISGRKAVSNDVSPLSALLTRSRLQSISLGEIKQALETVEWGSGTILREELLAFYHPDTLTKLEALRMWIDKRKDATGYVADPVAMWIQMVAMARLSGHSSGFFSGRSLPPNQSISIKAQERLNRKNGPPPRARCGGYNPKEVRVFAPRWLRRTAIRAPLYDSVSMESTAGA